VAKGIRWLLTHQNVAGTWGETTSVNRGQLQYTGTGFPRVFYLGYDMYRHYFPLLALTTYERAMQRETA
jgi:squalene-hopene/tetraprenyl-beta-curcumene cyclase